MYKKISYLNAKGRFVRIAWIFLVTIGASLFMGAGFIKTLFEKGKLEETISILKLIVGVHAAWIGYLGLYDFFNFYFSIRKKISMLVQVIFGILVALQIYFATLSTFDIIGLSNIPDIHNLKTFEGIHNFRFIFVALIFSALAFFVRLYSEKGEIDLRATIDNRM